MSRSDLQAVTSLVRTYLDEAGEPITWQDTMLLPIINEAQRKVVALLGLSGGALFDEDTEIAVPAGLTEILFAVEPDDPTLPPDPAAPPTLPDDLTFPTELEERASGATADYGPMERRRSRFSTNIQTTTLGEWMWKANKLRFIGATTDRQIRMEYRRRLQFLLVPSDPLEIPGSENAIAWRCVQNAEFSRGNPVLQATAKGEFNEAISELKKAFTLSMQSLPVRRRPYGHEDFGAQRYPPG